MDKLFFFVPALEEFCKSVLELKQSLKKMEELVDTTLKSTRGIIGFANSLQKEPENNFLEPIVWEEALGVSLGKNRRKIVEYFKEHNNQPTQLCLLFHATGRRFSNSTLYALNLQLKSAGCQLKIKQVEKRSGLSGTEKFQFVLR